MLSFYLAGFKRLLGIGKKILIVIAVYFIVISLFMHFINKDKPKVTYDPIEKNREEIYKVINDPKLTKTQEGKISIALYRVMMCSMIGEACSNNPADGDKNFKNSMLGFFTSLIVLPYSTPPASGVYWAYSSLENAGFVPNTYAAEGIGFGGLKAFANLWKVFRDISYLLLVLVLMAIGFMVMFRMKLNPQTVISAESALPKIVISLLLITFSFPIAGFLIDVMYLFIAILISILSNNGSFFSAPEFQQKYLNAGFWTILDSLIPNSGKWDGWGWDFGGFIFHDVGKALFDILPTALRYIISIIVGVATGWLGNIVLGKFFDNSGFAVALNNWQGFTASIGHLPEAIIKAPLFAIALAVSFFIGFSLGPAFVIGSLVFFTILLLLFRIFFLVFRTYLEIILFIILSPLILLFEAVPGRSVFSFWFKNLFTNILTFPIIIAIFIIGNVLVNQIAASNAIWRPPFLYHIDNPNVFAMLIGLGLIFLTPDLVKLIKELMGVKGLPISIGLGTFFAGTAAAVGGAQAGLSLTTSLTQMPGIGRFIWQNPTARKYLGKILPPTVGEQVARALEENANLTPRSGTSGGS